MRGNKTKIVCTIGPASEAPEVLERIILAGMDVARINFSHGDPDRHRQVVENIRAAARKTGRRVAIMGDLPGPKIRVGLVVPEPVDLKAEEEFTLTTEEISGDSHRVSVTFQGLPGAVRRGDTLFLNDGFIELEVLGVQKKDVRCRVVVGGELRSRKGVNLPGIRLGISAFTGQDREWLRFARELEFDAVSQSFVEKASDIEAMREAASSLGYHPFVVAKIERAGALEHMDAILNASDGIMIARGDLGVEVPIERIAAVQKSIIRKANQAGKPVITATQMLESMTSNRRPTRAEATDVSNAILDGTDCVMLSGESAVGKYPIEAVDMLVRIAIVMEPLCCGPGQWKADQTDKEGLGLRDLIASSVETVSRRIFPAVVVVPTRSGTTARRISRFRLRAWIAGVSQREQTCQHLQFSYGVQPVYEKEHPEDWNEFARRWLQSQGIEEGIVLLTEGPSSKHPEANNRMEIIDLRCTS